MKTIWYTVFAVALLFSRQLGRVASSYPLVTFCGPYQTPFVSGGYYIPTDGGACEFQVPATTTAYNAVAVYKGTPGNATLLGDFFGSGSQQQSTPTAFMDLPVCRETTSSRLRLVWTLRSSLPTLIPIWDRRRRSSFIVWDPTMEVLVRLPCLPLARLLPSPLIIKQ